MSSKRLYCKYFTGQKRSSGVRQDIRRKWTDFDKIWNSVSQMWGLALADFGRDPSSSDSLRGIVFLKKRKNWLQKFQVLQLNRTIGIS